MSYPVADIAAFLDGTWAIDRHIVDSMTGATATFTGYADFTPDGAAYSWVEAGELQWAGQTHRAGRRLLVAVRPAMRCVVDVSFDDGRFFHRADLSSGTDTFMHGCAPDTYYGKWTVDSIVQFRLAWDVDGPAKQLTIRSTYSRD